MSEAHLPTQQSQASQEARVPAPDVHARRTGDHQESAPQGPSQAVGLIWRVDRRVTFRALRSGKRRRSGPLTVSSLPGDPAEPPRVAFAIGKRVGTAVVRNRLRRRLRTCLREAHLRPGAYLVVANPDAVNLTYEDLRMNLLRALRATTAGAQPLRPPSELTSGLAGADAGPQ